MDRDRTGTTKSSAGQSGAAAKHVDVSIEGYLLLKDLRMSCGQDIEAVRRVEERRKEKRRKEERSGEVEEKGGEKRRGERRRGKES